MNKFKSCQSSIQECIKNKSFSIAHLYHEEKTMDIHIHDCYEIYYSISGGKQYLIDNKFYDILPGDIFAINQYESHYLCKIDQMLHERIVLSIHPDYIKNISTEKTDLNACFSRRFGIEPHRVSLNKEQQSRFMFYINKLTTPNDYGLDILEKSTFMELLVMINSLFIKKQQDTPTESTHLYHQQVNAILEYINANISEPLSILQLASQFYISSSYLCRIFKATTGTTINKYITARRISIAKSLLASDGLSVTEVGETCGFNDYTNFLKAFKKAVGVSPKKYAYHSHV